MSTVKVPIERYMTPVPHGIEPDESLDVAKQRMESLKVRHLPVRRAGLVVGVLTERDLLLLEAFPDIDFKSEKVARAMTFDPYCVSPSASASEVAIEMADRRIGSALVVDSRGKLLGIFTDTDALRALGAVLDADNTPERARGWLAGPVRRVLPRWLSGGAASKWPAARRVDGQPVTRQRP